MDIADFLRPDIGKVGFIIIFFSFTSVIPMYVSIYEEQYGVKVWGFPLYFYYYDAWGEPIFAGGSRFSLFGLIFDLILCTFASYLILILYEHYQSMKESISNLVLKAEARRRFDTRNIAHAN